MESCCELLIPRVGVIPERWTCPSCLSQWVRFGDETEDGFWVMTDGGPWQGRKPREEMTLAPR